MRSLTLRRSLILPIALACGSGPASVRAQVADSAGARGCGPLRASLAVEEVLAINLAVNRFDAVVLKDEWARSNFESWSRNFRLGWEWDENAFPTNMFAHPFHGSQYFSSGRANCLNYWESAPLAFLGSWVWEFFGETFRPSFNDFLMTSFGGVAVGEMTHRVAATLRDTETRGAGRVTREAAALLINPIEGINRLFRGQWTAVAPNPPEHDAGAFAFRFGAGVRKVHDDSSGVSNFAPTILVDIDYGDPLDHAYREPFDAFSVHVQVSPGGGGLNALQTEGRIFQLALPWWGTRVRHALMLSHRYDYINNPVYSFGAQSIETGLISRFPLPGQFVLHAKAAADVVVLGAINAPFSGFGERTYDFGPGAGSRLQFALVRNGNTYLSWYNRGEYVHSVSGAPADHVILFSGLEGNFPLAHGIGLGFYVSGDRRQSRYMNGPQNTRDFLESRVFLSWAGARRSAGGEVR